MSIRNAADCDHAVVGCWMPADVNSDGAWLKFTYCPKCGEQL